jgi:RNA polymerase primary sigma factor
MTDEIKIQTNNQMGDQWGAQEGDQAWTDARLRADAQIDAGPEEEHDEMALIPTDHTLNLYLKEVSRVPLLSKEEERELAASYRAGRDAERCLQEQELDAQERERLQTVITEGQVARQRLIRANTRLVISVAKKYVGRGVSFMDLIQEGNLGLIKAVEKFDHTRGFRLSTYATWWIRQMVTRALADHGRTIRVPVHMIEHLRRLYHASQELQQELGRRPTPDEIATQMELPLDRVRWMLQVSQRPLSLQRPVGEEEDAELGSFIEDKNAPTPVEIANERWLADEVERVLGSLPSREAQIVRLRFGLQDGRTYTLEEIGKKFGLTRERIRQIERMALHRLRHPRRSRRLRDYVG